MQCRPMDILLVVLKVGYLLPSERLSAVKLLLLSSIVLSGFPSGSHLILHVPKKEQTRQKNRW